jgi:AcrR family transcriptional regulator
MILPMRSDGESTRGRILDAAGVEFAQYGLAGARVDRIAANASASKERLYAYFGDKRSLFLAVLTAHLAEVTALIPVSADDIPGFVGGVFDFAQAHPEHFRMMDWARLGGDHDLLPVVPAEVLERDREAIRQAQERGLVDPEWEPSELFALLFAIALSGIQSSAMSGTGDASPADLARHRAAAVRAAGKLVAP